MSNVVIRTEFLSKSFGKLDVLKDISTEFYQGEVVAILGPSGSGKSTFLRCLNLLEQPTRGRIYFHDKDVLEVMKALALSGITMAIVTHEMGFARVVANRICSSTREV